MLANRSLLPQPSSESFLSSYSALWERISDAGELQQSSRAMLYDTVFPGHKQNMTGTHCGVKLIHKPLQRLNIKTYGKTPSYYFSKLVDSYT